MIPKRVESDILAWGILFNTAQKITKNFEIKYIIMIAHNFSFSCMRTDPCISFAQLN